MAEITLLEKIKLSLRIDDMTLDGDIQDTVNAAKADLKLCGILESKIIDTDALILRAVKTYCKAEYSTNEKESLRYMESYSMIRNHLSMSVDYNAEIVVVV